ncbi:hypothetical protein HAX54_047051, partial [Datura stramonium]|nr:hypothetical protein [Datura stramonium]
TMESKGKEVNVADKSQKKDRPRKTDARSSAPKIRELGAGYIFNEPERCNLTLVREFYANWDTSFGESTKVKVKGQVV